MKAIVIREYGGPDVLELREVPDPVAGPEDVLVRVRAAGVNRADLLERRGLYPPPPPRPPLEIPGLEFAGEVLEAGERTAGFSPGDRVLGITAAGAYAEKVAIHHRLLTRLPDGLDWPEAAALPEAFVTAADALAQAELRPGESVLIHAVGSGVGSAAVQVARAWGAKPIIGTARTPAKLEAARSLGLDVGIHAGSGDFAAVAQQATGGQGVDVIVDFVGAAYLEANLEALAIGGRMIVVGMLGGARGTLDLSAMLMKRLRVIGTTLRARPLEGKAAAMRLFERAVLPFVVDGRIRPVVDRTFALADAAAAHRYMESNANFGKIVLAI
ncbi:MAG: NAD(P)H-quinone oxidoreductase [Candidatus Dadabacteria bacterium]|nr:MAG: NAD(P)H-quinone oxidoreductase [Candidatus Dadabacteria bacterium]